MIQHGPYVARRPKATAYVLAAARSAVAPGAPPSEAACVRMIQHGPYVAAPQGDGLRACRYVDRRARGALGGVVQQTGAPMAHSAPLRPLTR